MFPLQGAAAALMPLDCFSAPVHNASAGASAHQHDTHADASHDQSDDKDGIGQNYNGHLSCHLFSAMPATVAVVAAAVLPALVSSIAIPIALFVPEQPQRPPRS
ncbi:MAG: hypothetical protein AABZ67_11420 [Pseudomonadota bacterium]